jgi:alpha-1,2-mannosyltransferase
MDCLLMLALAVVWRWRDHAWRGGLALGAAIALKLLFVPLLAWLVLTRRFAAAAIACASAAALWLIGWAAIGFHGAGEYLRLISLLTEIEKNQGYSSVAYAHSLGVGDRLASATPYVLGTCVIYALWRTLRRGGPGADAQAFLLGVVAVLAYSPIVWQHYLTLLLVPLAVLRGRFSLAWLFPALLWLTPFAAFDPADAVGQVVFAVAVIGSLVFALGPRTLVDGASALLGWRPQRSAASA